MGIGEEADVSGQADVGQGSHDTFNSVSRYDQGGRLRIELMVWREIALSARRITSVALLSGRRWMHKRVATAKQQENSLILGEP
ncbi:hypothetical protein J7E73_04700 [Paenibacillus albidus]|uniref:hypothetical protein n=1 Tax=Paenibacillus albidus TaxID=2041023 RepID=UPI001BEC115E|nr:hypothetical protein [Paenibacillus albidus]MBT2288444.1 hypothetical protein [Paenibacillus albidus]